MFTVWRPAELDVQGIERLAILDFDGPGDSGKIVRASLVANFWDNRYYTLVDQADCQRVRPIFLPNGQPDVAAAVDAARQIGLDAVLTGQVVSYSLDDDKSRDFQMARLAAAPRTRNRESRPAAEKFRSPATKRCSRQSVGWNCVSVDRRAERSDSGVQSAFAQFRRRIDQWPADAGQGASAGRPHQSVLAGRISTARAAPCTAGGSAGPAVLWQRTIGAEARQLAGDQRRLARRSGLGSGAQAESSESCGDVQPGVGSQGPRRLRHRAAASWPGDQCLRRYEVPRLRKRLDANRISYLAAMSQVSTKNRSPHPVVQPRRKPQCANRRPEQRNWQDPGAAMLPR